jgi:DNA polymerase I-like protein with 3'-5' exonuclease and polymerase domains
MSNEDLQLDYDCERFRLMSYQLENLLEEYDRLLELRENIQLKFFTTLENIKRNGIDVDEDYERWIKVRTSEREEWDSEIDLIVNLKYDIDDNLKLLDNSTMRRSLIKREIE